MVATYLNYTKAAQSLHLTQPAISMQIKQMEENIGLPLFEHLGKKIYLTVAGQELLRCSRVVDHQLAETEQIFEEMKGVRRGRLTIAVASTANYCAPRLLAGFNKRFAGIDIRLDVTNRQGLLQHLENNDVDIVIMGKPPDNLDVVAEPFMENPLVVIAPINHILAKQQNIPLSQLQDEKFLIREQGSGTRIAMERCFKEKGLSLSTGMEMSSNEAIKQAVQAELGLGIVSRHTIDMELETGRLVVLAVESFPIIRHWYIVHRQGKRLSTAAESFRLFILQESKTLLN